MKKAKKKRGPRLIRAKCCWLAIDHSEGRRELYLRTASGTLTTIVLPELDLNELNCAIGQLSAQAARLIKRERLYLRRQSQSAANSARKIADAMTCDLEAT